MNHLALAAADIQLHPGVVDIVAVESGEGDAGGDGLAGDAVDAVSERQGEGTRQARVAELFLGARASRPPRIGSPPSRRRGVGPVAAPALVGRSPRYRPCASGAVREFHGCRGIRTQRRYARRRSPSPLWREMPTAKVRPASSVTVSVALPKLALVSGEGLGPEGGPRQHRDLNEGTVAGW